MFNPHPLVTIGLVVLSVVGLVWCFTAGGETSPVKYVIYPLSAYALAVAIVALVKVIPRISAWAGRNPLMARYTGSEALRAGIAGLSAVLIDVVYAVFVLVPGVISDSGWAIAVALYYLVLAGLGGVIASGFWRAWRAKPPRGCLWLKPAMCLPGHRRPATPRTPGNPKPALGPRG